MTLDEAIAKAKADGDVQLAEWLRQARGADAAARWYTEKLREAQAENAKLRELAHLVAEYTSEDLCEGCVAKRVCNAGELDMCWIRKAILEKLRELGIEVDG